MWSRYMLFQNIPISLFFTSWSKWSLVVQSNKSSLEQSNCPRPGANLTQSGLRSSTVWSVGLFPIGMGENALAEPGGRILLKAALWRSQLICMIGVPWMARVVDMVDGDTWSAWWGEAWALRFFCPGRLDRLTQGFTLISPTTTITNTITTNNNITITNNNITIQQHNCFQTLWLSCTKLTTFLPYLRNVFNKLMVELCSVENAIQALVTFSCSQSSWLEFHYFRTKTPGISRSPAMSKILWPLILLILTDAQISEDTRKSMNSYYLEMPEPMRILRLLDIFFLFNHD